MSLHVSAALKPRQRGADLAVHCPTGTPHRWRGWTADADVALFAEPGPLEPTRESDEIPDKDWSRARGSGGEGRWCYLVGWGRLARVPDRQQEMCRPFSWKLANCSLNGAPETRSRWRGSAQEVLPAKGRQDLQTWLRFEARWGWQRTVSPFVRPTRGPPFLGARAVSPAEHIY